MTLAPKRRWVVLTVLADRALLRSGTDGIQPTGTVRMRSRPGRFSWRGRGTGPKETE